MSSYSKDKWQKISSKINFKSEAFINGKFVKSQSEETFDCLNPSNGKLLAKVSSCNDIDVDIAVKSCRKAFDNGHWSRMSPTERKKILIKLSDLILENRNELALLDSMDMGKTVSDAMAYDIPGAAELLSWNAEAIDKIMDEIAPTEKNNLAMIRRVPLGVIGAVVPWNYPLDMAMWKCAPALATGNSVILKPAEQSPLSALKFAELAAEAGLPEGVLNVVPGYGETAGKAIGMHNDIDCVSFTGSTEVGKYFFEYSAKSNMKLIWTECGGKSPNIIFEKCKKLDLAAQLAANGGFFNQGEVCSANSRVLVHKNVLHEFTDLLKKEASNWVTGDPFDPNSNIGCLVSEDHAKKVKTFIKNAKKDTELIFEGEINSSENVGTFVAPTIFKDETGKKEISTDEVFGPVLSLIPFSTDEEAIKIAHDSKYALAASIWTDDLSQAHEISDKLHAGTISVNTVDAFSAMTPFGGFKQSGTGNDLSIHAFDKYTGLKTVWIKY